MKFINNLIENISISNLDTPLCNLMNNKNKSIFITILISLYKISKKKKISSKYFIQTFVYTIMSFNIGWCVWTKKIQKFESWHEWSSLGTGPKKIFDNIIFFFFGRRQFSFFLVWRRRWVDVGHAWLQHIYIYI